MKAKQASSETASHSSAEAAEQWRTRIRHVTISTVAYVSL